MIYAGPALSTDELASARDLMQRAQLTDGRESAPGAAGAVKHNLQSAPQAQTAAALAAIIIGALQRNMDFFRMALPAELSVPMFNCYRPGMCYGAHYDAPTFQAGDGRRMRADLSATLFLSTPESYDGGELVMMEGGHGCAVNEREFKLPAGHIIVYPAALLHQVREVRSGERHAAVFWIQSMIRSLEERELFYRLDRAVQDVSAKLPGSAEVRDLTGVFTGLGRLWLNP